MLYIFFFISVHLHLLIYVFLCPYVNEVGGPNLSQQHNWLQECAQLGSTTSALLAVLIPVQECCLVMKLTGIHFNWRESQVCWWCGFRIPSREGYSAMSANQEKHSALLFKSCIYGLRPANHC